MRGPDRDSVTVIDVTDTAAPQSEDLAGDTSGPPPGAGAPEPPAPGRTRGFEVHLDNFEGPFDLLLGLISKHKLDITEVSLHKVTDEFIAFIRSYGKEWDLDQASHFLLVAATLLDLKAARLLPSGEVDDEEDLALLEARDLLFARLLQYRAYKEVARFLAGRMAEEAKRFPRLVPMEPRFADLLPEVLLGLGPAEFARLAARTFAPKAVPTVSVEHMYQPAANVKDQAAIIVAQLRRLRRSTFRVLTADCAGTFEVVARFLALLELYREQAVSFEQIEALGELHVTWTGSDEGEIVVGDDYQGAAEPNGDEDSD
ncbi:MAG: segregation and condensation protein [Streptosporangiaceae bacterium]|jgi:segregation and condensation protein A|nr:chromosome segregation and condensation protein ScpA [Streptosporangiaceae bacterium]MDX6428989.1 segregation and condensation protein [Streptosporangiaceae bacterium]